MTRWSFLDAVGGILVAIGIVFGILSAIWWGVQQSRPVEYWYDLRALSIAPTMYGEPVVMLKDAVVGRTFLGDVVVTLTDVETGESCTGPVVTRRFEQTAAQPQPTPVLLAPLLAGANPACDLHLGIYRVRKCVDVLHRLAWIGRREVCVESNPFRVTPAPGVIGSESVPPAP